MAIPGPRRRRTRLPAAVYAQLGAICSITVAVKARRAVFTGDVAAAAVTVLLTQAAKTGVRVFAYCIMPDHVHLLLGPSATCDLISFTAQFKNLSQRAAWDRRVVGVFWQSGFWDHFVRADEDLAQVIDYILRNPVRAGIVASPEAYGHSGSWLDGAPG